MIKRKVVSIFIIFIAFLLQTTLCQSMALANVVPNLLLVVTICYGYLRGFCLYDNRLCNRVLSENILYGQSDITFHTDCSR